MLDQSIPFIVLNGSKVKINCSSISTNRTKSTIKKLERLLQWGQTDVTLNAQFITWDRLLFAHSWSTAEVSLRLCRTNLKSPGTVSQFWVYLSVHLLMWDVSGRLYQCADRTTKSVRGSIFDMKTFDQNDRKYRKNWLAWPADLWFPIFTLWLRNLLRYVNYKLNIRCSLPPRETPRSFCNLNNWNWHNKQGFFYYCCINKTVN